MSGALIPAANQLNAEAHGLTSNVVPLPVQHAITGTELFTQNVATEAGGLGNLFGHNITHAVAVPLEQATDSVRTAMGGFIRAARGYVEQPNVVDGSPENGTPVFPVGTPTFTNTLQQQVEKLRGFFGVANGQSRG